MMQGSTHYLVQRKKDVHKTYYGMNPVGYAYCIHIKVRGKDWLSLRGKIMQ